jgi:tripeptidyl-peptidase-2
MSFLYVEQIEYHSLLAADNEVLFKGSEATARVDVKAALGTETLVPSATLNKVAPHPCALSTLV